MTKGQSDQVVILLVKIVEMSWKISRPPTFSFFLPFLQSQIIILKRNLAEDRYHRTPYRPYCKRVYRIH